MTIPRLRRRWVVLVLAVLVTLGVLRLLYQPLELVSYRVVDPQTLDLVGYGAQSEWTHVTGVTETDATVTIAVNHLAFEPFPHTDAGYRISVKVHLNAPLGNREVIDGSTGFPIPESS